MVQIFWSNRYHGNTTCLEHDPEVRTLRSHVFNPSVAAGCAPGLYDPGQKFIPESSYLCGPDPAASISCGPSFRYADVRDWAEDDTYIYLGWIHDHFGHFLLSTLSRLWCIRDLPPHRILCFQPALSMEIGKPYVQASLRALDIDPSRLVGFETPVKVGRILMPHASFEEQNFVHRVFARLCNDIGDRLAPRVERGQSERPIYLSKQHVRRGVRTLVDEAAICEHLARHGVEIAFPETLSLADQIALWRTGRPIVAFTSSGLHTSVFSPNARLVCLNFDDCVNTSFIMTDWANGTRASYLHFQPDTFEEIGPTPDFPSADGFSSRYRTRDASAAAQAILRAIDLAAGPDRDQETAPRN